MMRQMRKLHESVVSCYMNSVAIFFMMAVTYGFGEDLKPWGQDFSWGDKLCTVGLAISTVGSQTFRYKAL